MKHLLSTLFLLIATALFADALYQTPFHVEKRTILDAENREVRLWGVNYYAPFNHNFFNMEELGVLHEQAIDRDLAHFKLLGVNMIRMHLYEREITDPLGNLVENRNLEVFDYLVDRCEKEGIFLMISPITWWNTIANMKVQDEQYSYWHVSSQRAFGFTNFHSIDAMIWDQDAIDAQVRYMEGLFQHKNRYSGKPLCQYRNIVAGFCNAGFAPFADNMASQSRISQFGCAVLAIFGGLGVCVVHDIFRNLKERYLRFRNHGAGNVRPLQLHTRIMLWGTFFLLFLFGRQQLKQLDYPEGDIIIG